MSNSEVVVKAQNLSHRYEAAWAIRSIDFEISGHGVVGLLGSNGAGKSTTMNILCGVLSQTEGQVFIDGIDLRTHPEEAKRRLGFLPQNPPLHHEFTVEEYLTHCAHLRLIARKQIPAAVKAAQERCGIAHISRRLLGSLSGGYRQRAGIAQAIIHKPKLLVLDEPTNGLDPNQVREARALIQEIAQERAVLYASHILSEVHATCRHVIMIENGRMIFNDSLESFSNHLNPYSIVLSMGAPPSREVLQSIPGVMGVEFLDEQKMRLAFNGAGDLAERLIERSVAEGWQLREVHLERNSLESVFSHLSKTSSVAPE